MSDVGWILAGVATIWWASAHIILLTVEPHEDITPTWIGLAFWGGPIFLIFAVIVNACLGVESLTKRLKRRLKAWRGQSKP